MSPGRTLDRATQYSRDHRWGHAASTFTYLLVASEVRFTSAEHRLKAAKSFTKKYEVDRLVYFEQFDDAENAIRREKLLKKWNRAWKIRLIEELNPNLDDLYSGIAGV